MPSKNHHNYQAIDKLLQEHYDAREIGNQLDEIMSVLVSHGGQDTDYRERQEDHYHLLKRLRDIFWWLPQQETNP